MSVREDLLATNGRRYKGVHPPIGRHYVIQSLTRGEIRDFRNYFSGDDGELIEDRVVRIEDVLVADCLVDCDTEQPQQQPKTCFSRDEAVAGRLDNIDGVVFRELVEACKLHTGALLDTELEVIRDAVKNSEGTNGSTTTTSSPLGSDEPTLMVS